MVVEIEKKVQEVVGMTLAPIIEKELRTTSEDHGSSLKGKGLESSAAALHGTVKDLECTFCWPSRHQSEDSNAIIILAVKKQTLQMQKRCFRCTKPNHLQ